VKNHNIIISGRNEFLEKRGLSDGIGKIVG
jgi:hypothetical protein